MAAQTSYINLDTLHAICKGDKEKKLKYLNQLLEMIPSSIQKLKLDIEEEDRSRLMREIHFMLPQLMFFGLDDFSDLMKKEKGLEYLPFDELSRKVIEGISKIERALEEAEAIVDNE